MTRNYYRTSTKICLYMFKLLMQLLSYQQVHYQANTDRMLLDNHICSLSLFHRPTEQQQFCPGKRRYRFCRQQPQFQHGLRRHLDSPISNLDHALRDSRLPFIFSVKLFFFRKHSFQRGPRTITYKLNRSIHSQNC